MYTHTHLFSFFVRLTKVVLNFAESITKITSGAQKRKRDRRRTW